MVMEVMYENYRIYLRVLEGTSRSCLVLNTIDTFPRRFFDYHLGWPFTNRDSRTPTELMELLAVVTEFLQKLRVRII